MLTVREILPETEWNEATACDSVVLDYDDRHRRRFHYVALGGTSFLLDLARPTVLEEGDGLLLSDGRIIAVRAAPESLMEVRARDLPSLLRLAWHIGNRHLPAQIEGDVLRLRDDHVIRAMLLGLGAEVVDVSAPFCPEAGAYSSAQSGHGHAHDGDHHHDHHHAADHSHAG